jgi:hypothetical protein
MSDRLEMLTREVERWKIIVDLRKSIQTCNEEPQEPCDVCIGLQYAINIVMRRMENE